MGRSSGGGGGAGAVDYPEYMKTRHGAWLDQDGTDLLTASSMTALLNTRMNNSPFATASAFNPSVEVGNMSSAITSLGSVISATIDDLRGEDLGSLVEDAKGWADSFVVPEGRITALVDAHSDILREEYNQRIIPEYLTQMRDMGMVNSSAFAIGEALLLGQKAREVSKYDAEVRGRFAEKSLESTLELTRLGIGAGQHKASLTMEQNRALAHLEIETRRIQIVAKKEQNDQNIAYDEADSRWAFELYGYAGNLLASIQGAASSPGQGQPSPVQSALGGALAGASIGASGGAPGMAIGAAVGAGAGLMGII